MTIANALSEAKARLAAIDAADEARALFEARLCADYARLIARRNDDMPKEAWQAIVSDIDARISGCPLQYILGEWSFLGLSLFVKEGVLIPRGDSETLAIAALGIAKQNGCRDALDLCCGSGCLGLSLAALGKLHVTLCDISHAAVALARENVARHDLELNVLQGDLFAALDPALRFDLIVSNPPYIASAAVDALSPSVRDFEPRNALDGGEDGLDFYRRIANEAPRFLREDGHLALEIGFDQGKSVPHLLQNSGWRDVSLRQDLSGNDRVVTARAPIQSSAQAAASARDHAV